MSSVLASALDEDGDPLTYAWAAPQGTFSVPNARLTSWTAPMQPGRVRVTATVGDGRGGTISKSVDIDVIAEPRKDFKFDPVYFANDKSILDAAAIKTLTAAIKTLQDNPDIDVLIEGHTSTPASDAYNRGLGDRRAKSVYDYLVKHGIAAKRLSTQSFGEAQLAQQPGTDAKNRRVVLVVK
jgi:outer membrane protein OmpA-like peptidoglycan-associated protein